MEDGRGDRYHYDPEGQLDRASYRAVLSEDWVASLAKRTDSFTYDELGNRAGSNYIASMGSINILRRDNGLNQYKSWEDNRPLTDPHHWGSGIFHDDNVDPFPSPPWIPPGNGVVMQDGYITASFNALNQPVGIWSFAYQGTANWMFFGYDPLGRCVKRWVGPHVGTPPNLQVPPANTNPATYYYYDGWNLVQEGPSASSADRIYVHGGRVDEIVASQAGGVWRYHHYDARGHCIMLTDTNGLILEQYDYDAFGRPYVYSAGGTIRTASIYNNRFLFTGREWLKDLKLYDYRNRMYQPELGRFLQPDPKEFEAGDYNLYRYCHNDPVNKSDPTGLETLTRPETDELVADRVGAIGARIYKEADYMVSTGLDNIRNDAVGTALDVAALGKFSQLKSGIAAANRPGPNPVKEAAKAFFRALAAGLNKVMIRAGRGEGGKIVGVGTGPGGPTYRPKLDGSYSVGKPGEVQHFKPDGPKEIKHDISY